MDTSLKSAKEGPVGVMIDISGRKVASSSASVPAKTYKK